MSIPRPSAISQPGLASAVGKATVLPRKFTLWQRQGDGFARKVTVFARIVTVLGRFCRVLCHKCQHPLPAALLAALVLGFMPGPAAAKESLGVFGDWGAFRDPAVPRCYAIAEAEGARRGEAREQVPYASVGTWPRQQVRGQVHLRLSRQVAEGAAITLTLGGQSFALAGGGGDAWGQDRAMDAAIVAAMRSANAMSVTARDRSGRRFTDRYRLAGVATAMDAATVGCARTR